jgi:hypothetical protein
VIEIKGEGRVEVSTPTDPVQTTGVGKRFTITEDEFFRKLGERVEPAEITFLKRVLEDAPKHQLTVEWKQSGPLLKYLDRDHDTFFTLGGFDCWGSFEHLTRFSERCRELELPESVWQNYFDALVSLIPGASQKHARSKAGNEWEEVVYADIAEPLKTLAANESRFWSVIDKTVSAVQVEMSKR